MNKQLSIALLNDLSAPSIALIYAVDQNALRSPVIGRRNGQLLLQTINWIDNVNPLEIVNQLAIVDQLIDNL